MGYEQEIYLLRNKVRELERQVEHLRVSRRVLMSLIEKMEQEKRSLQERLEKENRRLQSSNCRYARSLMKYRCLFFELESHRREQGVNTNLARE